MTHRSLMFTAAFLGGFLVAMVVRDPTPPAQAFTGEKIVPPVICTLDEKWTAKLDHLIDTIDAIAGEE